MSSEDRKRLGLDKPITRREFIKLMMAGAGGLMFSGCSDSIAESTTAPMASSAPTSPPSARSYFSGNTGDTFSGCHRVSQGEHFDKGAEDTGEIYDLVVVGAGLGRLTSAYFYHKERPEEKILLLDNHTDFGCDAQRNELTVKGQRIIVPQGCDYFWEIEDEYRAIKNLWAD